MTSKNIFEIDGNEVIIKKKGWKGIAFTSYRRDYYDELTSCTWSVSNRYLRSSKMNKFLHRYIVEKWYGKELLDEMTSKNYIVDHFDNDPFNCRIENLYFLKINENIAKGHSYDLKVRELQSHISARIYRHPARGYYQVVICCNDYIVFEQENGKKSKVETLYMTFNKDLEYVYRETEYLLKLYNDGEKIKLDEIRAEFINIQSSAFLPEEVQRKQTSLPKKILRITTRPIWELNELGLDEINESKNIKGLMYRVK